MLNRHASVISIARTVDWRKFRLRGGRETGLRPFSVRSFFVTGDCSAA